MCDRQTYPQVRASRGADGADGRPTDADAAVSTHKCRSGGVLTTLTVPTEGLLTADYTHKGSVELSLSRASAPRGSTEPVGVSTVSGVSTALTCTDVGQQPSAPGVSTPRPVSAALSAGVSTPGGTTMPSDPRHLSRDQWRAKALLDDAGDDLSLSAVVRISGRQMPVTVAALHAAVSRGVLPFTVRESRYGPRIPTRELAAFLGIPLEREARRPLRSGVEGNGGHR